MRVDRIGFENFRNLKKGSMTCHPSVNVIYGDNAQGKTNLLEAVWLFSGARSFRGAKDADCVTHGEQAARLTLEFEAAQRDQTAQIDINGRRRALLNGVEQISAAGLAGSFRAVVFSPAHLSLIKDGPAGRRRFIDVAVGQLWPKYIDQLKNYNRLMTQRNAILRDVRYHTQLFDMLDVYDRGLCESGGRIAAYRAKYVSLIREIACSIYDGISGGKEELDISYIPSGGVSPEQMAERLMSARESDISNLVTSVGPHRDELEVTINSRPARSFGSQGQQRSAVIAVKLSEAAVIFDQTGERPVLLLDDVMSELDEGRQDYILNQIERQQVFITCCDRASVGLLKGGAAFMMKDGELTEQKTI